MEILFVCTAIQFVTNFRLRAIRFVIATPQASPSYNFVQLVPLYANSNANRAACIGDFVLLKKHISHKYL